MTKITFLQQRIFFVGMMGSGKSYWAKRLATHYKMPFFDIDQLIEQQTGFTIEQLFTHGEQSFRTIESEVLHQFQYPPACFVACGGGVPCFFDNMAFMQAIGRVIWLNPPIAELAKRLYKEKNHRPLLKKINQPAELIERLEQILAERQSFYQKADGIITLPNPTLEDFKSCIMQWN